MDISKILQSSLSELSSMFGAFKAYYAKYDDKNFVIEEIQGEKHLAKGDRISFDSQTFRTISSQKISVINCYPESSLSASIL
jgi:hypothetical protein